MRDMLANSLGDRWCGTDFSEFAINSLVQKGSPVRIKNLRSEAGKTLNGSTGTAQRYFSAAGRWSVECNSDGATRKICIQNLEWCGERKTITESFIGFGPLPKLTAHAGMIGHSLALVLYGIKEPSMDLLMGYKDCINAQFLQMGVPSSMWVGGKKPFRRMDKVDFWKRTGPNFFAHLGGSNFVGNISELGIKPPVGDKCKNCGKDAESVCLECHVGYCSKNCQKKDWKEGHKTPCKEIQAKKVKEAWRGHEERIQTLDRPDGEVKPFTLKNGIDWDPIREDRIFYNGPDGPIDTGIIVRHRIRMDDDAESLVMMMGKFAEVDIESLKSRMVGMMFYLQPFWISELFKLSERGNLLGEREPMIAREVHIELERIAGRKCNFSFKRIANRGNLDGKHILQDAYFEFVDVRCDDFFVENFFCNTGL